MSKRSVTHGSFTLQRFYDAAPARVFAAFADQQVKDTWFTGPAEWAEGSGHEMDFRVGGREVDRRGPQGGPMHTFQCLYQDIVPNERIIYTYDMLLGDERISVSLTTLEFHAEGTGTRLVLTEHGAFLDGFDNPQTREDGTRGLLDLLGAALAAQHVTA